MKTILLTLTLIFLFTGCTGITYGYYEPRPYIPDRNIYIERPTYYIPERRIYIEEPSYHYKPRYDSYRHHNHRYYR